MASRLAARINPASWHKIPGMRWAEVEVHANFKDPKTHVVDVQGAYPDYLLRFIRQSGNAFSISVKTAQSATQETTRPSIRALFEWLVSPECGLTSMQRARLFRRAAISERGGVLNGSRVMTFYIDGSSCTAFSSPIVEGRNVSRWFCN